MTSELERDKDDVVIIMPITDYATHHLHGNGIVLAVEYVRSQQEFQTGIRHQIQLGLTAQGALDLASVLRKSATAMLNNPVH